MSPRAPKTPAPTQPVGGITSLVALGVDLARLLDHVTRRHGSITLSQYQLLAALDRSHPEPLEPREIGQLISAGSAQVAALLDHLERAELLRRRPHATDRRRREVSLTDGGRARVHRVRESIAVLDRRLREQALDHEELAALEGMVRRLRAAAREAVGSDLGFLLTADTGTRPED